MSAAMCVQRGDGWRNRVALAADTVAAPFEAAAVVALAWRYRRMFAGSVYGGAR